MSSKTRTHLLIAVWGVTCFVVARTVPPAVGTWLLLLGLAVFVVVDVFRYCRAKWAQAAPPETDAGEADA